MRGQWLGLLVGLCGASWAVAQPFQIVTTVAPPGTIPQSQWKDVIRFSLSGSGSAPVAMSNIPNGQVKDPTGVAFRTPTDLFIGNRAGNGLLPGSISRFSLTNGGADAAYLGEFSQTGLIGVQEIAFNPVTRELFAATVADGIWRWTFDTSGQGSPNGSFARTRPWRGVCIEPSGTFLYASAATGTVFRFRLNSDGTTTELPSQAIAGASGLRYFALGPVLGEIYVADYAQNKVFRLRSNADGSLALLGSVNSTNAFDCAFSPDGLEMFVSRHNVGGIERFSYNAGTNGWDPTSTISTPSVVGFATYVPAICPADLTGEGFVDDSDFQVFVQAYNILDCADGSMPLGCPADLNLDGFVDDLDFQIFSIAYDELICS